MIFVFLCLNYFTQYESLAPCMFLKMALFCSFLWLSDTPWCVCARIHTSFIHSTVGAHLDCFQVLAFVNSTAVNIGVHVSLQMMVFSGCVYPGMGCLDY